MPKDLQAIGSKTARDGFDNEKSIADKFNNWKTDREAQIWLSIMNYSLDEIEFVKAIVVSGYKADLNVQIQVKLKEAVDIENLQVKLVSNAKQGFNQVDKRPLINYIKKLNWEIPSDVFETLKYFVGEILPKIENPKDKRRMLMTEFSESEQQAVVKWIEENKSLILTDVLRGRGEFAAEWYLVVKRYEESKEWVLKNINEVINHYDGEVKITPRGSIHLGGVTIQRKGGTPDPKSLQFKINPLSLFDKEQ